jgi:hypothetical protein
MAAAGIKVNEVYHISANDKLSSIDPTRLPGRIDNLATIPETAQISL